LLRGVPPILLSLLVRTAEERDVTAAKAADLCGAMGEDKVAPAMGGGGGKILLLTLLLMLIRFKAAAWDRAGDITADMEALLFSPAANPLAVLL
jgi:hypothetical protein